MVVAVVVVVVVVAVVVVVVVELRGVGDASCCPAVLCCDARFLAVNRR